MEEHDVHGEIEFFCRKLTEEDGAAHKIVAIKLLAFGAQAVAPLCALLREPRPAVRRRVVRMLCQISDAAAVEPLCSALKDSDAEVRETALLAIRSMNASESLAERIILARHMAMEARLQALKALQGARLRFHPLPIISVPDVHTICRTIIAGHNAAHSAEAKRVLDHLHDRETLLRAGGSAVTSHEDELLHPASGAASNMTSTQLLRPSEEAERKR